MNRPAWRRRQSVWAPFRARMRWPMYSRPCICSTAASCRWPACWPGTSTTARRCSPHRARPPGCRGYRRGVVPPTPNAPPQPPAIGYQETIRKAVTQRGRHKKQSGGHGQFGDVVLEIKPLPRGGGFEFHEKVVGGAVPRNYIGAVEEGVVDGLLRGPLGFPVIDVQATLIDGSYHSVDSSDLAFRTAARIGVSEALPQCQPVLLEPIHVVEIVCPTRANAKINAILSGRRGQILGFDTREGWPGWDRVRAMMPEAEIGELIVELRSATAGAGSFTRQFDRMAEVTGRAADQIIAAHRVAA